jgi:hypothetical protein
MYLRCQLEVLLAAFAVGVTEGKIRLSVHVAEVGTECEIRDGLRATNVVSR